MKAKIVVTIECNGKKCGGCLFNSHGACTGFLKRSYATLLRRAKTDGGSASLPSYISDYWRCKACLKAEQ